MWPSPTKTLIIREYTGVALKGQPVGPRRNILGLVIIQKSILKRRKHLNFSVRELYQSVTTPKESTHMFL